MRYCKFKQIPMINNITGNKIEYLSLPYCDLSKNKALYKKFNLSIRAKGRSRPCPVRPPSHAVMVVSISNSVRVTHHCEMIIHLQEFGTGWCQLEHVLIQQSMWRQFEAAWWSCDITNGQCRRSHHRGCANGLSQDCGDSSASKVELLKSCS